MASQKDLIPAYVPQQGLYRDNTGSGDLDAVWHRYKNVNIRSDGAGGATVSARQEFEADATNSKNDASGSRGRGMIAWQNYDTIVVDEDTVYYDGGSAVLTGGNDLYAEYRAVFTQLSAVGVPWLIIQNAGHTSNHASANHGNLYYMTAADAAPTRVTDVDMPGNNGTSMARGAAHLNGYMFVLDINGNIYNSAVDDITTWAAADVIVAEREADVGIYIGKHKDHIFYIGSRSVEFFWDNANSTNSPLNRREDVHYRIGCTAPNTVVEMDDRTYFVGIDAKGQPEVYAMEEFSLTPISDDYMRRNLSNASIDIGDLADLEPVNYDWYMAYHYNPIAGDQLVLTTGDTATYVYTFATQSWVLASTDNDWTYKGPHAATTNVLPIVGTNWPINTRVQFANGAVGTYGDPVGNAGIKDFAESTAADSYAFTMPWDANTDERKRIPNIRVLAYRFANSGANYTTSNFSLAWEDLDAEGAGGLTNADFTDTKQLNLNITKNRVYRCGTTRQRIFKFQFDDNGIVYIKGIEVNYDILRG